MPFTALILWTFAAAALLFLGGFALAARREGERRAAILAAMLAMTLAGALALAGFLPVADQTAILLCLAALAGLAAILFLLPARPPGRLRDVPSQRIDERDILFARARLQPGSENYRSYYAMRPENEASDDLFRARPGLLSDDALLADPLIFALPRASFSLTEAMHTLVEGDPAPETVALPENPARTELVKALARYYGALEVGVTSLRPEHLYTHIGRGSGQYGAPIELNHRYAIAFSVEMDHRIMGSAPQAPAVMESARQYVEAGRTAVQLAAAIRGWGYPARAHIDGDYRVICPLAARDAGLGEIGRMGLLMTPRLGPRVRLGVVTTDLELIPDEDRPDASVIDFCAHCGKCAQNCPPKAIPFAARSADARSADDRIEIDGARRWRINSELCFRYWCAIGTDCGRCMAVCPYSHPSTFYHNLARWGIRRSWLFRRAMIWLDDVFYGRHPRSRAFRMGSEAIIGYDDET